MSYLHPAFDYDEPHVHKGRWQTQCSDCDWSDDMVYPYQDECDHTECQECGSENVIDVNLEHDD